MIDKKYQNTRNIQTQKKFFQTLLLIGWMANLNNPLWGMETVPYNDVELDSSRMVPIPPSLHLKAEQEVLSINVTEPAFIAGVSVHPLKILRPNKQPET